MKAFDLNSETLFNVVISFFERRTYEIGHMQLHEPLDNSKSFVYVCMLV